MIDNKLLMNNHMLIHIEAAAPNRLDNKLLTPHQVHIFQNLYNVMHFMYFAVVIIIKSE
jgi:hypothetical protein